MKIVFLNAIKNQIHIRESSPNLYLRFQSMNFVGVFVVVLSIGTCEASGSSTESTCDSALISLRDALQVFKQKVNAGKWTEFKIDSLSGSATVENICNGIPEKIGQEIWKLATGISEPGFRQTALGETLKFLKPLVVWGGDTTTTLEPSKYPERVCSAHNTPPVVELPKPEQRDASFFSFGESLILFLAKAYDCLEKLSKITRIQEQHKFKRAISDLFKNSPSDLDSASIFANTIESDADFLIPLEEKSVSDFLKSKPFTSFPASSEAENGNIFFYITQDIKTKIQGTLSKKITNSYKLENRPKQLDEKRRVLYAKYAKAILYLHPGFFMGDQDTRGGDFIDLLKLIHPLTTNTYGEDVCRFTPTIPTTGGTVAQAIENTLGFVRYLEAKILCGGETLDDVPDGPEPFLPSPSEQSENTGNNDPKKPIQESEEMRENREASDSESPEEILTRLTNFSKNLNEYMQRLTLAGIPAAEAATRVQVQAALAELAQKALADLERIKVMKDDVEKKIELTMTELGKLVT